MSPEITPTRQKSYAYNMFILFLTVLSLVIMIAMYLPLNDQTIRLLQAYDTIICIIFFFDFIVRLRRATSGSHYFLKEGGWLDLLGSIPSFGPVFKHSGLFRLARLNRLFRITVMLRGDTQRRLIYDIGKNRSQYAGFVTILLAMVIVSTASVLVLQFEIASPDSNIRSGWDAFWYSVVTLTTVGYGDRYPVTLAGRITAMFIMFTGVGIIGALASVLSSVLVGQNSTSSEEIVPITDNENRLELELARMSSELASIRQIVEKLSEEKSV